MIRLDAHRYDGFKEIYFDTVFGILCGLLSHTDSSYRDKLRFGEFDYPVVKELVWLFNDYDLYPCFTGEGTDFEDGITPNESEIGTMSVDLLQEALKPFILGKVEEIRKARNLLLYPELDEGRWRGSSLLLHNALKKRKLRFCPEDNELKTIAEGMDLWDYIPYGREKDCLKILESKQSELDESRRDIYDILNKRWTFLNKFGLSAYRRLREQKPVCDDSYWNKKKIPECLILLLDIRNCPYCNRNYIGTIRGRNLGYQMDHYINKSDYPLFCLSLYNLVPTCSACNGYKSNKDYPDLLSPFEEGIDYDSAMDFYYIPSLLNEIREGNIAIRVKDEIKDYKRYKTTLDKLDLDRCYKYNKPEADTFIQKMIYYPPSMIAELGRTMGASSERGVLKAWLIEESLFGEGMGEADNDSQYPLSMMYRHLYHKYRK